MEDPIAPQQAELNYVQQLRSLQDICTDEWKVTELAV